MIVFPVATNLIFPLLLFDYNAHHHHRQPQLHQFAQQYFSSIIVASGNEGTTSPVTAIANIHPYQDGASSEAVDQSSWNLPNGNVQFQRPLSFRGMKLLQDGSTLQTDDSFSYLYGTLNFLEGMCI